MLKSLKWFFFFSLISLPLHAASLPPAQAKQSMVVTSQHLATKVGVAILRQGGNAIDAAVAVGYALAVVEPCCGNIGGGGFMLIHLAQGKNTFINFREKAPAKLHASMFFGSDGSLNKQKLTHSYLAAGVPGTVMGLNYALKKYGSMTLKQVMQPAIRLAEKGFILARQDAQMLKKYGQRYFKQEPNVAHIFLNNGKPYQAGERLRQPQLAATLRLIASQGSKAFYHGKIAKAIVQASQQHGGVFSVKDFADYTIEESKPLVCYYRGYKIITASIPSGGGVTLCQMLAILAPYPFHFLGFHAAASIHYQVEAMRHVYADREHFLGDTSAMAKVTKKLLSQSHITQIQQHINPHRAGDSNQIAQKIAVQQENLETTHYSIVDRYGNAVSVTYTINGYFGNKLIAGNTGFFLNNEMADFSLMNKTQLKSTLPNALEPGKRPLSSMTPTIIMHQQKVFMVLGTPGGKTIPSQILQVIQNVIDFHMDLSQAVTAARFHMQWLPDKIFVEPFAFSNDTIAKLTSMGHALQLDSMYGRKYWSSIAAILRDPQTGIYYGVSDPRRPAGLAQGY